MPPNGGTETPPNCDVRTLKNLMSKKKSITAVVSSDLVRPQPGDTGSIAIMVP